MKVEHGGAKGYRQAARHDTLTVAHVGSNPTSPVENFSEKQKEVFMNFIKHTVGCGFTNMDNVISVLQCGKYITVYAVDGSKHNIAKYKSYEEAKEALEMIMARMRKA